jgi:Double-stranded DNA-binding domain.
VAKVPEAQSEPEDAKLKKAWAKRLKELQVEKEKRETARRFMDIPAYERLMNVRMSNYTLYMQMLDLILATVQSKRIAGKITEEQLKDVLYKLTYKPDTKIEFRHK